jgi:hypothetical protein
MSDVRSSLGWGLALVAFGLVLLLQNLELMSAAIAAWPWAMLAAAVGLLVHTPARRAGSLATPLVLLVVGGLFAVRELGMLPGRLPVLPLLLVVAGVVLLSSATGRDRSAVVPEPVSVPLEGEERVRVVLAHGAGTLRVAGGAGGGAAVEGTATGGASADLRRSGKELEVALRPRRDLERLLWARRPLDWDLTVSNDVAMELEVRTGASRVHLDLTATAVDTLIVRTGASELHVLLPVGDCRVDIDAGAAEVDVRVPDEVAASVQVSSALASVDVDQRRFLRRGSGVRTEGYEAATYRAEIELEGGVASFAVR